VSLAQTTGADAGAAANERACDGRDDDCDGAIDEGLAGVACNAGSDACPLAGVSACDGAGGVRCEAIGPAPVELCSNGIDDDCDAATDAADGDCPAPPPRPVEGVSAGAASDRPLALEPSSERAPIAPRRAPAGVTPMPGGGVPPLESPSAASLGGGGGCQLDAGPRAPVAPSLLLAAAVVVRCLRRTLSARSRR
jgi:hypothetical protein